MTGDEAGSGSRSRERNRVSGSIRSARGFGLHREPAVRLGRHQAAQEGRRDRPKVAKYTLTATNIKNGAVTSAALANDSLTVSAGSGLAGGGSIALGGAGSLHVEPSVVQSRVSGACAPHTAISAIAQAGTVTCSGDAGTVGGQTVSKVFFS